MIQLVKNEKLELQYRENFGAWTYFIQIPETEEMNEYIATFYSHFGAVCFKKACVSCGLPAVIMPVPRSLSSSCGTCVKFQAPGEQDFPEKNGMIAIN